MVQTRHRRVPAGTRRRERTAPSASVRRLRPQGDGPGRSAGAPLPEPPPDRRPETGSGHAASSGRFGTFSGHTTARERHRAAGEGNDCPPTPRHRAEDDRSATSGDRAAYPGAEPRGYRRPAPPPGRAGDAYEERRAGGHPAASGDRVAYPGAEPRGYQRPAPPPGRAGDAYEERRAGGHPAASGDRVAY
ncbi:hypothetical protein AB0I18_18760, partial [Streptomyces sp. NPDC050704]